MQYRTLGRTGLAVSEIALGCEGLAQENEQEALAIFDLALRHGVNCLDLYTPNPLVHRRVRQALGEGRKNFILQGHLCAIWDKGQYRATRKIAEVRTAFETLLANLGTDYIDIGMIHYVDSPATWKEICEGEIMAYARALQKKGVIRHLGLSSHNPEVGLLAVESGLIDVLMFSVNPCYDLLPGGEDCEDLWAQKSYAKPLFNLDPQREALYEACQRDGVGITVMKAFGGGDLLSEDSPAGKALTVHQCLHYALTRPGAAAVMCGAHKAEELAACLSYEQASPEEKDYAAAFASFPKISWEGHCMYCGHCAPCPKGIDVALLTKLLRLACRKDPVPETVREHYAALSAHGEDCIACGLCEQRCPFHVPVRDNMAAARKIFTY